MVKKDNYLLLDKDILNKLKDSRKIGEIPNAQIFIDLTDDDWHVRRDTVEKINDEKILMYVAKHDTKQDIKKMLLEKSVMNLS